MVPPSLPAPQGHDHPSPLLPLPPRWGADVGDEQTVVVPQQQQQHQQQTAEQQNDQQGETTGHRGRGGDATAHRERKRRGRRGRGGAAVEPQTEMFESRWFEIRCVLR